MPMTPDDTATTLADAVRCLDLDAGEHPERLEARLATMAAEGRLRLREDFDSGDMVVEVLDDESWHPWPEAFIHDLPVTDHAGHPTNPLTVVELPWLRNGKHAAAIG